MFQNSDGLRSLIYLYGLLSSSSSPLMLSFVKSQLKSLNDDASAKEFGHLIDVMCNWGRGEDLLDSISEHLHGSLTSLLTEMPADPTVAGDKGIKLLVQLLSDILTLYKYYRDRKETCFFRKA